MLCYVAMSSLLHWSKGEQNQLFSEIFGKVAELNWMWEKTIENFIEQVYTCMCSSAKIDHFMNFVIKVRNFPREWYF